MKLYLYLEQLTKQDKDELDERIYQIKLRYRKKRDNLKTDKESMIDRLKEKLDDFIKYHGRDIADELQNEVSEKAKIVQLRYYKKISELIANEKKELDALRKVQKIIKSTKHSIAGVTMAAIIIATSYQTYKYLNNEAKKKCLKYEGKKRLACIKIKRIELMKKRLNIINQKTINCDKSKDPDRCRGEIDKFVLKLRDNINDGLNDYIEKLGKWNIYR